MAGTFLPNEGLVKNKTPNQDVTNWGGEVLLSTRVSILDEDGFAIGFIKNFTPNGNRSTERIRQIGHADAGRVVEQDPKPEDLSFTANGFALYNNVNEKGSLAQRLGAWNPLMAMKSLQEQHYGFTILIVEKDPRTDETIDATEYQDCWIQTQNRPYSIDNITILDSVTVFPSRVGKPDNWKSL